ncbi:MAG: CpsD/CapB family tyrosine-protein kinase [Bacteroidota bacterium]
MAAAKDSSPRSLFTEFSTDAPYVTEARRLMQSLMRQHRGPACRVYMISSASRGEGKSTICALLGIVAARIFHRHTLVIDADLRRPTMHHLLDVSQKPGLYELMHGETTLDLVRRPTSLPLLHAIPSGKPGPHVSDSYDDAAFEKLLQSVRPSYDLIFVDAAPIVPVVEPIMMAEHADGILLVAMAGRTPITMIRRMRGILAPVAAKVAGAIVNNATEGLPYYYDYSYYGYKPLLSRRDRKKVGVPTAPGAGGPPPGDGAAPPHAAVPSARSARAAEPEPKE